MEPVSRATAVAVTYPGARGPERDAAASTPTASGSPSTSGATPDAPPVLLAHGGFDFARHLRRVRAAARRRRLAGRVVGPPRPRRLRPRRALRWEADVRDALAVMDSIGPEPMPIVGHSKGGGVCMQLTEARPHRVSRFVNLDGMPRKRRHPDVADHERSRLLERSSRAGSTTAAARATLARKPGTLDELAARRGRMNPRLSREWLRYLVTIGARKDADGWRWKIDPVDALRRLRPVAPGVVARAHAAASRCRCSAILGLGRGGDGLGHDRRVRHALPAARRARRSRSRTPATSCTSSTRGESRSWSSNSCA